MTENVDTDSHPTGTTRRTVLRAAGLAALAGGGAATLAGCSDAADSGTAAPDAAPPSAQVSSPAGSPSASGSAPAPPGPSVAKADIPEGGGVVVQQKYVVTQPTAGQYKGFTAVCTHKGCIVNKVADKQIGCPCHGSQFSITDGSPVAGPAEAPLTEVKVTVSGDQVVISA